MKFLKLIFFPLSILYGIILLIRNKFYDWKILTSMEFNIPVISVGNLCLGGTGKSPHVEYLIRTLKLNFFLAILSRGYGRNTLGFLLVNENAHSLEAGDEPLQFKRKFTDVVVAVDKKRVHGIKKIQELFPKVNLVLLDDAFQHRAVKPVVSILLTDFNKLFMDDFVIPGRTLREFRSGYKRANIIIVSKSPENIDPLEKKEILNRIMPLAHQRVYFSFIKYGDFIPLKGTIPMKEFSLNKKYFFEKNFTIILLTGIANSDPLEKYLKEKVNNLIVINFGDHHQYSITDLSRVKRKFNEVASANKIILTTEKDAMRLDGPPLREAFNNLPVYYIPIEIGFSEEEEQEFNKQIMEYIGAGNSYL